MFSDHKPLEENNIKARTDEELGDLAYYLSKFDFEVIYSPGKYNLEVDCLSRNPVLEPGEDTDNQDQNLKIVNFIQLKDIQDDQEKNEHIKQNESKLILKDQLYYKKVGKREKIVLTED